MTHVDDPKQIEADLEKNRSGLASALDELTNRASVDYVAREALGMLKVNTQQATRTVERAIQANPMAYALIGAGVVWAVLGANGSAKSPARTSARTGALTGRLDDPNPDWHSPLASLRETAQHSLAQLEKDAQSRVDGLTTGLQDQVGHMRDFAAERAKVVEDFAQSLKSAIMSGLDTLSDSARDKIVQARHDSYAALVRAERMVKGGTRDAVALVEDHPIATGAVALAIGAFAGIAFLRSGEAERRGGAGW